MLACRGNDHMAERDARANTTAVCEDTRRAVRRFRGPVSIVSDDPEARHIRVPLHGREALIVVDGEERWVSIDDLSDWSDKEPAS